MKKCVMFYQFKHYNIKLFKVESLGCFQMKPLECKMVLSGTTLVGSLQHP